MAGGAETPHIAAATAIARQRRANVVKNERLRFMRIPPLRAA